VLQCSLERYETGEEMCEVESHSVLCCVELQATGYRLQATVTQDGCLPRFACDRAGG